MSPPKGFTPWNKGTHGLQPWTEEQRKKASLSHMGNTGILGQKRSEESKRKQSETAKAKHRKMPPEFSENLSRKLKGRTFTPEWREKISKSNKGKTSPRKGAITSEETKLKISISKLGKNCGDKCHLWKGGISYEPYCIRFTRKFKERVRWFFGNTCVECGKTQTNRKMYVHHVNYDKMVCCNDTKPLFVALCNSCHCKTNFNREHWEEKFTKRINEKYGGKCYYSDEEFNALLLTLLPPS
jgi:hypothetical protein